MELPISFLRECFSIVGKDLIWNTRPISHFKNESSARKWNAAHAGKIAGYISKHGRIRYRKIRMESKFINANLNAHRIAYALHHGHYASFFVDHIDGDGLNNSKENLRDITNSESNKNMRKKLLSKSVISGVYFNKAKNKWYASIHTNGVKTHLGCFASLFDACAVRMSEQNKRGFSPRHGRP